MPKKKAKQQAGQSAASEEEAKDTDDQEKTVDQGEENAEGSTEDEDETPEEGEPIEEKADAVEMSVASGETPKDDSVADDQADTGSTTPATRDTTPEASAAPAAAPPPDSAEGGPKKSSKFDRWMTRVKEDQPATVPAASESSATGNCTTPPQAVQAEEEAPEGWHKINFEGGMYEGEIKQGQPNGYGRVFWKAGSAYHGEFVNKLLHGKGTLFMADGRKYEGEFKEDRPCGEGILTEGDQRYVVSYDGSKTFAAGAVPVSKAEAEAETITDNSRFTGVAVSRGHKLVTKFQGNYSHCRPVDGKLAVCRPTRANLPLANAHEIEGKIAVCWRGGCTFSKKVRYCQEAGAIGVLIMGCGDEAKYTQVFQVHEGDPKDDTDVFEDFEVPKVVTTKVPVMFALGKHEPVVRAGAFVRMRFFPGAPGTPDEWLLGCVLVHPQTIHRDLTKEEGDQLLNEFLNSRKEERLHEQEDLRRKLSNKREGMAADQEGKEWADGLGDILQVLLVPTDRNYMAPKLQHLDDPKQDLFEVCEEFLQGNYKSMLMHELPLPFHFEGSPPHFTLGADSTATSKAEEADPAWYPGKRTLKAIAQLAKAAS